MAESKNWTATQIADKIVKLKARKEVLTTANKDTTEVSKWIAGWEAKLAKTD